ncbi:MAG: peptidase C39 family protein, partial [Candidatus Aenigmarchaeota archaeon]|nr:peptidase C39 family protein [Candidatus Aenigmarchaeota archaeon]
MRTVKKLNIPFYRQSTSFTCDPACLMMALKYFYPKIRLSQELEFDIWRESYGIGIPGCMPQGIAYSTLIRKLNAIVICRRNAINKIPRKIAKGENKQIAELTSKELFRKAASNGMKLIDKSPDIKDIEFLLEKGQVPIIMVNMKLLHNIDSPHW